MTTHNASNIPHLVYPYGQWEVLNWYTLSSAIIAHGLDTEAQAHMAAREYIDRCSLSPRVVAVFPHAKVVVIDND